MDWNLLEVDINNSTYKTQQEQFNSLLKYDPRFLKCFNDTLFLFHLPISGVYHMDFLLKLYDSLDYMDSQIKTNIMMYPYPPSFFQSMYNLLEELIKYKTRGMNLSKYDEKLGMTDKKTVNGYKLYNVEETIQIFKIRDFIQLNKLLFSEDINISYDEFVKILEDKFCSDWYKEDVNGECYGGYWEYPKGSYERENAYDLTFKSQCDGLWNLPYPKQMIIEMINHACCRRMDNVRGVNCLCEWIKQKSRQVMIDNV